jgi:hypothetical protein
LTSVKSEANKRNKFKAVRIIKVILRVLLPATSLKPLTIYPDRNEVKNRSSHIFGALNGS